ncbi:hypothetical protein KBD49_13330 [Myxococcota bacterium]|nr:hypothetical protein [Myxococcota bacterium]
MRFPALVVCVGVLWWGAGCPPGAHRRAEEAGIGPATSFATANGGPDGTESGGTGWPDREAGWTLDAGEEPPWLGFAALFEEGRWRVVGSHRQAGIGDRLLSWPPGRSQGPCEAPCGVAAIEPGLPAEVAFFVALEDLLRGRVTGRLEWQDRRHQGSDGRFSGRAMRFVQRGTAGPKIECRLGTRDFQSEGRPGGNFAEEAEGRLGIDRRARDRAARSGGPAAQGELLLEMGPLPDPGEPSVEGGEGPRFRLRLYRSWLVVPDFGEVAWLGHAMTCDGQDPLLAGTFGGLQVFRTDQDGGPVLCVCLEGR